MAGLILETETEAIAYADDGHLVHTHMTTFVQRRSIDAYPDFETAKSVVEADLGRVRWEEPEQ
jgi:hypothetical protein